MSSSQSFSVRFFSHWAIFSYRYAVWIILLILALTTFSTLYTAENLGVHTDTTDMLSEEVPFRANHIRYIQSFPQHEDTLLLALNAPTPEQVHEAAKAFTAFLNNDHPHFSGIYYLAGEPFLEKNGLFFKDLDELTRISDYLAAAQPLIARIAESPTLYTFSAVLTDAAEELRKGRKLDLESVFSAVSATLDARIAGQSRALSWQALLGGEAQKSTYQELIIAKPKLDYSQIFAAEEPIAAIRSEAEKMGFAPDAIKNLRITGEVALAHDELNSAMHGAQDAGLLALVLVAVVLLLAFRSAGAIVTVMIALILGLLLTAAFATVAVGHLNLISIAFAVLYIGLGVDYAIHFLLRLEELRDPEQSFSEALNHTGGDMGQSLLACAITTAIGFYAFMPTTYRGVAELGLISGTGMLISFLITMTLIPALQRIFPVKTRKLPDSAQSINHVLDLPRHSRKLVYFLTVAAIAASILALPKIRFDYNLLNLNNPRAESVQTFQELLGSTEDSPWHINILVNDSEEIEPIVKRVSVLPEVKSVISMLDLVPQQQEEKSLLIEEMAMILGPVSFSPTAFLIADHYTVAEQRGALDRLRIALERLVGEQPEHAVANSARKLQASLANLLLHLEKFSNASDGGDTKARMLRALNDDLLSLLPGSIQRLQLALSAQPFGEDALPVSIKELWQGSDGVYRIAVYPQENINDNDALRRFVRAVQEIAPSATGIPVISLEAGEAVVDAFIHAFTLALLGVVVALWIMLRSIASTALVLIPLLLSALFTCAGTVLLDLPFNFANIIALPLLLGIGIDSSLHMVHRSRSGVVYESLLHTSTARAIFYSALTTLVGFGSLVFSMHQGTSSMGLLLTIGLLITIVCVLIILPVLLQSADKQQGNPA
ncbi:MAG: MMPL family transporter [Nitrosomonas sp.]|uniref:MMPL family transporter n=1 Tax=Nitrosomonas sp. TaxID=42353 RepID=UPI001DCEB385|nr:MMPL family transporter [Nitrosomonas sp.]MBX9893908.1 MMPL family transporter [Nitrosomonas sp.]